MTPTEMLTITALKIDQLAAQNMSDYHVALVACGYSDDEIATALAAGRAELARRRTRALCEMRDFVEATFDGGKTCACARFERNKQ